MADGVNVDLAGLAAFSNALRAELDNHLRLQAVGVVKDSEDPTLSFGNGVTSAEIYAMRDRYHRNLSKAVTNLRHYVTTTQVIAEAVARIAAMYAAADGVSADSASKILADSAGLALGDVSYESVQQALSHVSDVSLPDWDGRL